MIKLEKIARHLLMAMLGFLALTAYLGGLGLLMGVNAPSRTMLEGSIFNDFTVPGLTLFIVVGGSALMAAVALSWRKPAALPLSVMAGVAIMVFEFVQILVIGSPEGVARNLQMFYLGLGFCIVLASGVDWFLLTSLPGKVVRRSGL